MSVILKLIDVDEDRCLSIGEVFKMIYIIEKNFVTELNFLTLNSSKSYIETALSNSFEKFKLIITKKHTIDQINQRFLNQCLITYQEFISILKKQPQVFKNFLPKTVEMSSFLQTRFEDPEILVEKGAYAEYHNYLKDLHREIRGREEADLFASEVPIRITEISTDDQGSKSRANAVGANEQQQKRNAKQQQQTSLATSKIQKAPTANQNHSKMLSRNQSFSNVTAPKPVSPKSKIALPKVGKASATNVAASTRTKTKEPLSTFRHDKSKGEKGAKKQEAAGGGKNLEKKKAQDITGMLLDAVKKTKEFRVNIF